MSARASSLALLGLGAALLLLGAAWLASGLASGKLEPDGFLLGLILLAVLASPFLAGGFFLWRRGLAEAAEEERRGQQRRLLDLVESHGQIRLSRVAQETRMPMGEVRRTLNELVGLGLFTGYVNWEEGMLYSRQAREVRTTRCPNCGGERQLVGQGVVRCPYCGVEIFL